MTISWGERIFLTLTNILIVTVLIIDLFHLSGLGSMDPKNLALANLIILSLSFISYRLKNRMRLKKPRQDNR